MDITADLIDSWNRQCQILDDLIGLVTPDLLDAKPSEDGMTVREQFCHIGNTRRFWLTKALGGPLDPDGRFYRQVGDDWEPIEDLAEIRRKLKQTGEFLAEKLVEAFNGQLQLQQYENPVLFLQHMLWHEGYHYALIVLAMRLAGHEPAEDWEETHVWQVWRGVELP